MSLKKWIVAASTLVAAAGLWLAAPAHAQDKPIKIALIASKTGPSEAYARDTERGFRLGLEYLTGGTMTLLGRKIEVIVKDDQMKPELAKAMLTEALADDKADIAVGTSWSGGALSMAPVAEEYGKILMVEPAIADSLTGSAWNKYLFRASRNSFQDALASAAGLKDGDNIAFLAPDYVYGKDGVKDDDEKNGLNHSGGRFQADLLRISFDLHPLEAAAHRNNRAEHRSLDEANVQIGKRRDFA